VGTNGSSVRAASGAASGIEWQKNNLAASGPAPIASTDTQKADANRRQLTAKFYATRAASRSLS
jgi:hypothetical protein